MKKLSVVFVALTMVFAFSVAAMAAQALIYSELERLPTPPTKSLEIYGSVRMGTYWITSDKEINSPASLTSPSGRGQNYDDSDLLWQLDEGATRFGVRFKSGKIGGNVEIRPRDQNANSYSGTNSMMRHWYGTYDMGFGTFIVGQTYTPTWNPICNECLLGGGGFLDGFGDMGGSVRKPGLQLHMPIKSINGLLKLALLEPTSSVKTPGVANTQAVAGLPTALTVGGPGGTLNYLGYGALNPPAQAALPANWGAIDQTLPAIEGSISAAFGPTSWTFRGAYNTFDIKNVLTDSTESIDTYLGALDGTYSMGAFYLRGVFYYGQNLTSLGNHSPSSQSGFGFLPALYTTTAGGVEVEDTDNWGWFGVAGYKFNDMVSLEAGYGERHAEQDNPLLGGTNKDTHNCFVIFAPISITPAFVITPEILYADFDELEIVRAGGTDTVDRGKQIAYGIYWRIDF